MGNRQIKKSEPISEDAWEECRKRGLLRINSLLSTFYKLDNKYEIIFLLQNGSVCHILSEYFTIGYCSGSQDVCIKEKSQ